MDVGNIYIGARWEILVLEYRQGHRQGVYFFDPPSHRPFTWTLANVPAQKNLLWVADLEENQIGQNIKWVKLIDDFEAKYEV